MPYYEKALRLLKQLQDVRSTVEVLHIYREFNGEADGLANSLMDAALQVRESWLV